jgi:hypothetical protein
VEKFPVLIGIKPELKPKLEQKTVANFPSIELIPVEKFTFVNQPLEILVSFIYV